MSLLITVLIVIMSVSIAMAGDQIPMPELPDPGFPQKECGDECDCNYYYHSVIDLATFDTEDPDISEEKLEKIRERYTEMRKKIFFRNAHGQFVFLTLEEMKQAMMVKEDEPRSQFIILDFFEMEEARIESFHNYRIENFEEYKELMRKIEQSYE